MPARKGSFVERDRFCQAPRLAIGTSEVITGTQGAGVVRAKQPMPLSKGSFVERDGSCQAPRLAIGTSEVITGTQGPWMVRAKQPMPVGKDPFVQLDRFSSADLLDGRRTPGWRGTPAYGDGQNREAAPGRQGSIHAQLSPD